MPTNYAYLALELPRTLRQRVEQCARADAITTTHVIRSHLVDYLRANGVDADPGIHAHTDRAVNRAETTTCETVMVKVAVSPAFRDALRPVVAARGETVSGIVREHLQRYVKRVHKPLDPAREEQKRILIHLSLAQRDAIREAASAQHLSAAQFARIAILNPRQKPVPKRLEGGGPFNVGVMLPVLDLERLGAEAKAKGIPRMTYLRRLICSHVVS